MPAFLIPLNLAVVSLCLLLIYTAHLHQQSRVDQPATSRQFSNILQHGGSEHQEAHIMGHRHLHQPYSTATKTSRSTSTNIPLPRLPLFHTKDTHIPTIRMVLVLPRRLHRNNPVIPILPHPTPHQPNDINIKHIGNPNSPNHNRLPRRNRNPRIQHDNLTARTTTQRHFRAGYIRTHRRSNHPSFRTSPR